MCVPLILRDKTTRDAGSVPQRCCLSRHKGRRSIKFPNDAHHESRKKKKKKNKEPHVERTKRNRRQEEKKKKKKGERRPRKEARRGLPTSMANE